MTFIICFTVFPVFLVPVWSKLDVIAVSHSYLVKYKYIDLNC